MKLGEKGREGEKEVTGRKDERRERKLSQKGSGRRKLVKGDMECG
jgi:hypothetical protein